MSHSDWSICNSCGSRLIEHYFVLKMDGNGHLRFNLCGICRDIFVHKTISDYETGEYVKSDKRLVQDDTFHDICEHCKRITCPCKVST